eukprot:CAMPEP_0196780524 /NCGR_PEP_ID=MMETSP1104-20130614/7941_1 /TAXON_ID=33652 /ORGANISM="Cafeteria sp., Strain Caron Lab Isolate" /LENGTH=527 /DNA_ID=CAMNT_0042150735 /DNA_START=6 /DNA_END=1589 /DNA_ORIENTATION=-
MRLALATLVLAAASMAQAQLEDVRINPTTQEFVDSLGRIRYFRGLNAVSKLPPFSPPTDAFDHRFSIAAEDVRNLQEWGFNVIRLGLMWSAVEPQRGQYNTTYLDVMRQVVASLADGGVYTILDAHQDAMSRRFCGEGFPDFAVQPSRATQGPLLDFPAPLPFDIPIDPATGRPDLNACTKHQFALYYITFECASAWQAFYESRDLHDAMAGSWRAAASAFHDQAGVLGYELLNEPWLGSIWTHPLDAVVQGKADRENLVPLYERLHAAIREVDDERIVFYEPTVSESYLRQSVGFEMGPGGRAYDDRQALAYHLYCIAQNSSGDPRPLKGCESSLAPLWDVAQTDYRRVGGGAFLTEFGALGPHQSSADLLTFMLDEAERRGQSWTYWTWKDFNDITTQNPATETLYNEDGSLQLVKLKALSRPYAPAVAAQPGSVTSAFDTATGVYTLAYTINPAVTAPTDIFLASQFHYPNGANITIAPSEMGLASPDPQRASHVLIHHDGRAVEAAREGGSDALKIRITVSPL